MGVLVNGLLADTKYRIKIMLDRGIAILSYFINRLTD